ncbi:MAG: 5'-nucleotidase C-terminal domain-containing protein [Ruminococcus sp.]|jgi:5'-nucleotidase|nr:5'-nucleotidase C-terminal domain-containing protein [Ruminococcus sp.]
MELNMKKITAILSAIVLIFGIGSFPAVAEETPIAVFYHTGETEGFLNTSDTAIGADIIASVVKEKKSEFPATFFFDTGDAFQGSFLVNVDSGENAVNVMNAMGYDAMTIGNHDLDYGLERTLELADNASFPILIQESAAADNPPLVSTALIERGGITVGVLGITTPAAKHKSNGGFDLDFGDISRLKDYATETAAKLRSEGADIVVLLSHIGTADSDTIKHNGNIYDIANNAKGIDLIIDGDIYVEGEAQKALTPISIAGEQGEDIGVAEVYRDANGGLSVKTSVIAKSATLSVAPDSATAQVLAACNENAERLSKNVVAISMVTLTDYEREIIRSRESVIADMVADSMRWAANSDIAFCNAGNVRGPIFEGKVTLGVISNVLPYSNIIYVADLKGSIIREVLQYSASLYGQDDGGFMQVSGVSYSFDPEKPEGERLIEVTVNGEPLEDEALYSVATFDFLALGGDGYDMLTEPFTGARAVGEGDIAAVFAEYLNQTENSLTETQNRIRIVPGGEPDKYAAVAPIFIVSCAAILAIIILFLTLGKAGNKPKRPEDKAE